MEEERDHFESEEANSEPNMSVESDISGGDKVGIKTCWYNPNHKENNTDLKPDYEIDDLIQVIKILKQ